MRVKPGFHTIVRVVAVALVSSDIFETIGVDRGDPLTRVCGFHIVVRVGLVEFLHSTTTFWCVIIFQNAGCKSKSKLFCVLLACCGCFMEGEREGRERRKHKF